MPKKVDDYTTLVAINHSGRMLRYEYVVDPKDRQISATFSSEVKATVLPTACNFRLHRVSFAFEVVRIFASSTRAVRGSLFRAMKTSPADAVALSLALRALTAGKAFFDVATNSGRARVHASVRLGRAIFLCS